MDKTVATRNFSIALLAQCFLKRLLSRRVLALSVPLINSYLPKSFAYEIDILIMLLFVNVLSFEFSFHAFNPFKNVSNV